MAIPVPTEISTIPLSICSPRREVVFGERQDFCGFSGCLYIAIWADEKALYDVESLE